VGQAKNYAGKLAVRYTYSSNGQAIYGIDMETGKEGEIPLYPTPDELWNMTFAKANAWRDRFAAVPYPDKSGTWSIRFYQEISVSRVLESITGGGNRVLLTLATGTGKTSIAFQIAWKLFNARWNLTGWKSGAEPTRRPRDSGKDVEQEARPVRLERSTISSESGQRHSRCIDASVCPREPPNRRTG